MIRIIFLLLILLTTCAWGIIHNQNEIRKVNVELDLEKNKNTKLKQDLEKIKLDCIINQNNNILKQQN